MHGNSPEFLLLVNAEVDSMGGVIDGGVAVDSKISPRRAAIEKAQAELRQEYDVREERRRELEFLEKGGNPLDFKLGPATSISVQSTSVADQFVNSEAKDSFALTASPRGDSVESSGRPGAALARETNTADNLLLFDGENDIVEGERNSTHHSRSNVPPSEQASQLDGCHNIKESEESGVLRFVVKSQAYARRNRSRSSRDSARVCSTDLASVGDRNGSSVFRSRHGARDAKGIACEVTTEKDRTVKSTCNSKSTKPNGNVVGKTLACDNQLDKDSDARQGTASAPTNAGEAESDVRVSKKLRGIEHNKLPQVDDERVPKVTPSMTPDNFIEKEGVSSALNCMPSAASTEGENVNSASQPNSFNTSNVDGIDMPKGGNITASFDRKGSVDPEPSSIQIGLSSDGNISSDHHPSSRGISSPGYFNKEMMVCEISTDQPTSNLVKEESDTKVVEVPADNNDNHTIVCINSKNSGSCVKVEDETGDSRSGMKNEVTSFSNHETAEHNDRIVSKAEGKPLGSLVDSNAKRAELCLQGRPSSTAASANCDPQEVKVSGAGLIEGPELQICAESQLKLAKKVHEDSILEEARSIEAKRKRIAELSVRSYPSEYRRKSHWDFVLEEMAWLANDFMQERLWKTTAAAQISHMAASSGRLRINKQNVCCKQRQIAHKLTKAVMEFWQSAEFSITDPSNGLEGCMSDLVGSQKVDEHKATGDNIIDTDMQEMSGHLKEQNTVKSRRLAVQGYAVRFLKYSSSLDCPIQAEAPKTPERLSDSGIVEMLLEDRFSEETLFYTVPPGAMEEYRKSVENYWSHYEITGSSMHREEVETSIYGAVEEFGTRETVYEDDEAGAYYLHGAFERSKSSKSAQKKKKKLHNSYARYDAGADLTYGQFTENKLGANHSSLLGKRPPNNLNVGSIPIKRVRTASRRVVLAGAGGSVQMPSKTDASSGDTSSYQDDQSIVHGGSHIRKTLEVESTGEFGKQLPFDCTEVSMKPKKKKKAKHLVYKNSLNSTENGAFVIGKGPAYEQRWQLDSMVQNEQRDYSKKRLESHAFESNGNSGVFGQHATKRPKIMKQDTSESNTPVAGSVPSPVASQMSNMSNPNKFMKMIAGRERGRKTKALKMPAGQSGAGSPWSLFEDQALVVLVHDMGPNWELVSDAISSTLQFKCIFRNPKECKERHKILMDRNAGDGADSAEDSGSSQPYPSTLPGIPKGSARQLFQRLQGPMEEDTLKSHFEKIILIGQKQHSRRTQSDNQASKQITPVHNSHVVALSQVCPNNLSGVLLTPLDLCDTTPSSSDVSLGYQGSHSSGLAISSQGPAPPVQPTTTGANPMLQGPASVVHDNSLASASSALNTSSRDAQRYGVPRQSSLPNNENQKMPQYSQMHPGKSSQHSTVASPGSLTTDRGVRILPGGNGMGMMSGMSRGMPLPRPGYQGIGSPSMLNMASSGSMLSSSGVGMPSPVNMHNGAVSGPGNSMMRPREALHMMRAPEEQRQMTMQELQMQVTQGISQGIPPFNSLSAGYSNQTVSPPVQTFPVQHQQQQMTQQQPHVLNAPHHQHLQGNNHAATSQQQAYMLRIAKERQLHQRILHQHNQQQHQFASSNATGPHVQPPLQHPISSPLQNNPQIQQQTSSQPISLPSPNAQHPLTSSSSPMNSISSQPQQKQHHLPPHALGRNPQATSGNLPNQVSKQRQRQQQHQQPGRHPPQQRQQTQSQQQAKLMKGIGRGNMMMHQSVPIDTSHVNGLSVGPGNQVAEKGEQGMHLLQGPGLFSGSASNPVQQGKPSVPPHSTNQGASQQKLFTRSPPPSSKQLLQMPSHTDVNNQGQVPAVSSAHTLLGSKQPVLSSAMPTSQQQQPQLRQSGQSQQTVHRMLQQNRQASSDSSLQSSVDQIQVNQQPLNSTFHMAASTAPPQCCTDSTSVVPVSSASSPSQWKAQEPLYDLGSPNAANHLAGNPSLPSSSGSEQVVLPSQGISQRQSSGSIPILTHNVQTQWQPHLQQQKQPLIPSSPPLTQQQPPPSQQPQPQQQSQQKPQQNLQSPQSGLYAAPTNSGPT